MTNKILAAVQTDALKNCLTIKLLQEGFWCEKVLNRFAILRLIFQIPIGNQLYALEHATIINLPGKFPQALSPMEWRGVFENLIYQLDYSGINRHPVTLKSRGYAAQPD